MPLPLEPLDSAAVAADAVRAALRGEPNLVLPRYPAAYRAVAPALAQLPAAMRAGAVAAGAKWLAGVPLAAVQALDDITLDSSALDGWPDGPFAEVHMGAPSGAAAAAAAAAGAPYLPTSALFAIRLRKRPDDLERVLTACRRWGPALVERFPGRQAVWHHDPVHDRFLVAGVLHLRLRLKEMPRLWQGWLRDNLARGGRVVVRDLPGFRWPRWDLEEAGALQVGGLGDLAPEEYPGPAGEHASLRLCADAQESEWGCEAEFVESVEEWGRKTGAEVAAKRHSGMAGLLAAAWEEQVQSLSREGFVREGVAAVDCFTFLDPGSWHRLGIPVLWAPFNTRDTLALLGPILKERRIQRTLWTAVPAYPATQDTASYQEWEALYDAHGGVPVGVDPARFPVDPLAPSLYDGRNATVRAALETPL